jgi:glycine/D-amino acid oxidase-like deaminating enzyme
MSVSVWRDARSNDIVATVDVAIIGGGIAGLAIARQCVARGLLPAVIEARDLAAGATGRNAGFAMTGLADHYVTLVNDHGRARAREIWQVSQENLRELIDDVAGGEGIACDLVPCGSVVAAWSPKEREEIAASHALLREDGFDVDLLDADAANERLGSQRFLGGLFVRADHGVHPVKLVRGLAANLAHAGARILEHHEVRAIEDDGDGVRVRTAKGDIKAPRVVLATNAYTRQIEPYFRERVVPVRGQVLATAPVPPLLKALVYTDDGFEYARQLPDGTVVAGGWRRAFADSEVGYADEITAGVQEGIEEFLHEAWPSLRAVPITHRWSGVMGFSKNGLPMVGMMPSRPRVGFAVGFTGHGLGFAFAAARRMVDVLSGGSAGIFSRGR